MFSVRLLTVSLWIATACGCAGVLRDASRTVAFEPHAFHPESEQQRSTKKYSRLAYSAWRRLEASAPDVFSLYFARGYQEGYVDYLKFGGDGEPPPVPPRDYWGNGIVWKHRRVAVNDWFEGFREGAAEARMSGLREEVVVPSSFLVPSSYEEVLPLESSQPLEAVGPGE